MVFLTDFFPSNIKVQEWGHASTRKWYKFICEMPSDNKQETPEPSYEYLSEVKCLQNGTYTPAKIGGLNFYITIPVFNYPFFDCQKFLHWDLLRIVETF